MPLFFHNRPTLTCCAPARAGPVQFTADAAARLLSDAMSRNPLLPAATCGTGRHKIRCKHVIELFVFKTNTRTAAGDFIEKFQPFVGGFDVQGRTLTAITGGCSAFL